MENIECTLPPPWNERPQEKLRPNRIEDLAKTPCRENMQTILILTNTQVCSNSQTVLLVDHLICLCLNP